MKNLLSLTCALALALCLPVSLSGQDFIVEDAERFAKILAQYPDSVPSKVLQKEYIEPGTRGVKIFMYARIKNARHLSNMIQKYRARYEKGIELMLPAAQKSAEEAANVLAEIQALLKQEESAPVYAVFGGNNSGGTASGKGLVLGLEVLSRFAENEAEAIAMIRSFVAHEVVHVYQARVKAARGKSSLLKQSLREGFPDFIENYVLKGISNSEKDRHEYGLANEAQLWSEFKEVMYDNQIRPWMYGKGKDGRPSDLGYWIGKRICEAYYNKAENKEEALQTLLKLEDIDQILKDSGYDPGN